MAWYICVYFLRNCQDNTNLLVLGGAVSSQPVGGQLMTLLVFQSGPLLPEGSTQWWWGGGPEQPTHPISWLPTFLCCIEGLGFV